MNAGGRGPPKEGGCQEGGDGLKRGVHTPLRTMYRYRLAAMDILQNFDSYLPCHIPTVLAKNDFLDNNLEGTSESHQVR